MYEFAIIKIIKEYNIKITYWRHQNLEKQLDKSVSESMTASFDHKLLFQIIIFRYSLRLFTEYTNTFQTFLATKIF